MDGTIFGVSPLWVATGILLATYVAIMVDRINRAIVAVSGACLVILAVTRLLELDPYPFLLTQVMASNTGGTATLIGDPPNIMIGSQAGLGMDQFLIHMAPIVVVIMLVQALVGHAVWARGLHAQPLARARVMAMDERAEIRDRSLLIRSLAVVATVVLAFLFARPLGLEPGTIALTGAAVLLLMDCWGRSPEEQTHHVHNSLSELEWITLLFFAGLFVIVAGAKAAGLLDRLGRGLIELTGGDFRTTVLVVLWASALLSAIVDNIPFVATMIPLLQSLAPAFGGEEAMLPIWVALSLGACLGGNGTLVGASANITVAGIAERNGVKFGFLRYTRSAAGLTLVSIAICHLYLMVRYL